MADESNEAIPEAPATWENVVVGKAKEVLGHVIGDEELVADGDSQEEIAQAVHEEYQEEHAD